VSNSTQAQISGSPSPATEPDCRPGLRERKKERNRERLQQAAFELFAERGFDNVTVDEVAERAEVSKSTLFRYFESKEDLLLADTRAHRDALLTAVAARPTDEPVLRSLREALRSLAQDFQADRGRAVARARIMSTSPTLASRSIERQIAWEDGLAAAILPRLADRDDPEMRASVLAGAAMAAVRVGTRRWLAADDDSQMIDHVLGALDVLAHELKDND
jgi:AcrR family transcriptional regulator